VVERGADHKKVNSQSGDEQPDNGYGHNHKGHTSSLLGPLELRKLRHAARRSRPVER
jgi:hypothetical protein